MFHERKTACFYVQERIISAFVLKRLYPEESGFFIGKVMFTGIISHLGILKERVGSTYAFSAPADFCKKLTIGASVSVNGTCLTVFQKTAANTFSVSIMPETQKRTILGSLKEGNSVNLELPATPDTFLAGHIVQGHVDGIGKVGKVEEVENSRLLTIKILKKLAWYIVEKGSIAINGVSLTVIAANKISLTVGIIPHTWEQTTFNTLQKGDSVNIEVDVLAKYVSQFMHYENKK